jgi:hypothetical protein
MANEIVRVPHPTYGPDLAQSNFWLFGHMKAAFGAQQFGRPDDLLSCIQTFLEQIPRSELELVFHHWIERARWVLQNDGDYFHE